MMVSMKTNSKSIDQQQSTSFSNKNNKIKNNKVNAKIAVIDNVNTNSNSSSTSSNSSSVDSDPRMMDAADTLVSLAHSTTTTPTSECKSFENGINVNNNNNSRSSSISTAATRFSPPQSQSAETNNFEIVVVNKTENNEVIEQTIKLSDLNELNSDSINEITKTKKENDNDLKKDANASSNKKDIVESACKLLIEQVLKSCKNGNLSSITIKTTAVHSTNTFEQTTASTSKSPVQLKASPETTIATAHLQLKQANSTESFVKLEKIDGLVLTDDNNKNQQDNCKSNNLKRAYAKTVVNLANMDENNINITNFADNESIEDSQSSSYSNSTNDFYSLKTKRLSDTQSPTLIGGANSGRVAPTLATGRKSKDIVLPSDEAKKRQERRERNKEAAARCRRKRDDLTVCLTKQAEELNILNDSLRRAHQELQNEKLRLESLLASHEKVCSSIKTKSTNNSPLFKLKREDITQIIKQSNEKSIKFNQVNINNREKQLNTPDSNAPNNNKNEKIFNFNLKENQLMNNTTSSLTTPSAMLTPNSASNINQNSLETLKTNYQSTNQTNNSVNQQQQKVLQRPNNLSLKNSSSPTSSQSSSSSSTFNTFNNLLASATASPMINQLFQNFLNNQAVIGGGGATSVNNIIMTPIQLNTPIMNTPFFTLTPLENTLNALGNCQTSLLTSQQIQSPLFHTIPTNQLEQPNNSSNNSNNESNATITKA